MALDAHVTAESQFGQQVESRFGVLETTGDARWVNIIIVFHRVFERHNTYNPGSNGWIYYSSGEPNEEKIALYDEVVNAWNEVLSDPYYGQGHNGGPLWGAAYGNIHWHLISYDYGATFVDAEYLQPYPPAREFPSRMGYREVGSNWSALHRYAEQLGWYWPDAYKSDFWALFNEAKRQLRDSYGINLTPGRHRVNLIVWGDQDFSYDFQDYEHSPNQDPDKDLYQLFLNEFFAMYGSNEGPDAMTAVSEFFGLRKYLWLQAFDDIVLGSTLPPDFEFNP
jgi:hypothetical protein